VKTFPIVPLTPAAACTLLSQHRSPEDEVLKESVPFTKVNADYSKK